MKTDCHGVNVELEIGIENLLKRKRVEPDCVEFRAEWNPDEICHTVCAFANDIGGDGCGYILVGVEEKNGMAVRPVKGLSENTLDSIQKEMVRYNNLISPPYFPGVSIEKVDGQYVLVIIARTGARRPYKAPEYVISNKERKYHCYIRYLSSTVKANPEQESILASDSSTVPFDCQPNYSATLDDINTSLLQEHLKKTGSKLSSELYGVGRGVEAVLEDMQLFTGPKESRHLQNVALMMFCDHCDKFFMYTHVQMTKFPSGSVNSPKDSIDFPLITGSVPQMIEKTMDYFKLSVFQELVIKVPEQMEALRIKNYPYEAIEEVVVNAFYHRDYSSYQPIIIEIEPDCINVMNFPGFDRSISKETITEGKRFVSRHYRNRRLGEFLKELQLTEGHSSGIPTIQEKLRQNGSPAAEFITDEDRSSTRVRIPIHPAFLSYSDKEAKDNAKAEKLNAKTEKSRKQITAILDFMNDDRWYSMTTISEMLDLKPSRTKELLKMLVDSSIIEDNGQIKGRKYKRIR